MHKIKQLGKPLGNIFNIKSNYAFLPCLALHILKKYPDPFYLANITILLPSKRACRQMKQVFLQLCENKAMILPKILAIGDVDYDDVENFVEKQPDNQLIQENKFENITNLINEINAWNKRNNLFGKNISNIAVAEIAANLQNFLDEVEKEGLDLDNLEQIAEEELAAHKQKILAFLRHFGSNWQNILAKKGLVSLVKYRNLMLAKYADFLHNNKSDYPIIAAGSTGSVLATAKLLKIIANLKNGNVVLLGLDKEIDDDIWEEISEIHPQFMVKKLLDFIGVDRKEVLEIGFDEMKMRDGFLGRLCSLAMLSGEGFGSGKLEIKDGLSRPPFESAKAASVPPQGGDNFHRASKSGFALIEVADEFEEARMIALILREVVESEGKNAALISNDADLICLVKQNLARWKINIDDSKNSNLAQSKLVEFLLLIAFFLEEDFSIINLLAILKHPLNQISNDQKYLALFEKKIARNIVKFSDFKNLINYAKKQNLADNLIKYLQKIADIFQPFLQSFKNSKENFKILLKSHINCANQIANNILDDENPLIEGKEEFKQFLDEVNKSQNDISIETKNYCQFLNNLLKNYQLNKKGDFHPNLHILSTMEARLMNYDLTIISGFYEGQFPPQISGDWLGNKIRSDFGLPAINKKIGVNAYDFCNYLNNEEVILTYPKNSNNSPTVKSRFWLKIEAILKMHNCPNIIDDGKKYLNWLQFFDEKKTDNEISRPWPKTKEKLTKISATDISKWLIDPYYIYLKRILKLKPLKEIEQDASFAEFGNFVHKVLEEFVKDYEQIKDQDQTKILINNYGKKIFIEYFPDPNSHLLWWPRFENIAKWFVKNEQKLRKNLHKSFVEVEANTKIADVELTTKIDRINLYQDGSFEIIDYKTGTLPQDNKIKCGLEPQLAIEAIVLFKGKIKNYPDLQNALNEQNIKNLQYQNLKGRDQNKIKDLKNPDKLISAADIGLVRLIEIFTKENFGYVCCPDFDLYKENEYFWLERIG